MGGNTPLLLFFWDYDAQWGADRSRTPGGPKHWGQREFENTEWLLDLHRQYNISACFAVVGSVALSGERPYHDMAQIRRIHAAGHEIASHTHRHEWLPGLDQRALLETLRSSKDALEQCIGAPVLSFVPPYNQPYDYPAGWSFSLSERREAGRRRIDLAGLCDALGQTGYRFCRVAYRPIHIRLAERFLGRRLDAPVRLEKIGEITCARLSNPRRLDTHPVTLLRRGPRDRNLWVLNGHPHAITRGDGPQSVDALERLLCVVDEWRRAGNLKCALPRDLV
jgi:peptidoglycan/xylan/chitin deacetylase (PgdA/CDA1 family)